MHQRYNLAYFLIVVALGLTPLMVGAAPQAQIVFSSHRDGNWEIYVMDTNGKNQRRLTNTDFDEWEPSWSPDGKRIAFTASEDRIVDDHPQIYVMDVDGGNQQILTNNDFDDWDPSWSPDGRRIAFVSGSWKNHDIYVIDADGENLRNLSNNDFDDRYPSWSSDGRRITFASEGVGNFDIYVMNADGARQVRRHTKNRSGDADPAWFDPAFAVEVAPFAVDLAGKKFTMWGWLKAEDFMR